MSNWDEDDDDAYCTAAADYQDARAVARELGIPLHRVSFAAEYRERVFEYFLSEQRAGRTPNPDVLCNREIKFGVALRYARAARRRAGRHRPLRAPRAAARHGAELLQGARSPRIRATSCTPCQRAQLRARADAASASCRSTKCASARARAGLPVFDKPDSTGICFIGERPFREFLAQFLRDEPGPIETPEGERARHASRPRVLHARPARGPADRRPPRPRRGAVVRGGKDSARNALVVVQGHDHPLLSSRALITGAAALARDARRRRASLHRQGSLSAARSGRRRSSRCAERRGARRRSTSRSARSRPGSTRCSTTASAASAAASSRRLRTSRQIARRREQRRACRYGCP